MYRFANRVRKLDAEEVQFYEKVESDTKAKENVIQKMERQELEKFRNAAEATKVTEVIVVKEIKRKDVQGELLKSAVKKRTKHTESKSDIKPKSGDVESGTDIPIPKSLKTQKGPIIVQYPDSSDSN